MENTNNELPTTLSLEKLYSILEHQDYLDVVCPAWLHPDYDSIIYDSVVKKLTSERSYEIMTIVLGYTRECYVRVV